MTLPLTTAMAKAFIGIDSAITCTMEKPFIDKFFLLARLRDSDTQCQGLAFNIPLRSHDSVTVCRQSETVLNWF